MKTRKAKAVKKAKRLAKPKQAGVRSKPLVLTSLRARASSPSPDAQPTSVRKGLRLPQGPKMTWEQRAKADVDAN